MLEPMSAATTTPIFLKINKLSVFSRLKEINRLFLCQHAIEGVLKKGQALWRKQDSGEFCVVILSGLMEIRDTRRSGEERIVGLFGPGEMIGLSALLSRKQFPADAIAASKDVQFVKFYIRSIDVDIGSSERVEIHSWLREMLLKHEQILRDKLLFMGADLMHTRLLDLFEHLRLRFSSSSNPEDFLIPIPITKTQIAKLIEVRVESLIRTLNKWEKAGHLKMGPKGVSLKGAQTLRKKAL